jgi:hypothetical protein
VDINFVSFISTFTFVFGVVIVTTDTSLFFSLNKAARLAAVATLPVVIPDFSDELLLLFILKTS